MATNINMKNVIKVEGHQGNVPGYAPDGTSYWNSTLKTNVYPVNKVVFRGTTIYEKGAYVATINVDLLSGQKFTSNPGTWTMNCSNSFNLVLTPQSGYKGVPTNMLDSYLSVQKITVTSNKKTYSATPIQLKNYYIGSSKSNIPNWIGNVPSNASVTATLVLPTGGTTQVTLKPTAHNNGTRLAYIWSGSYTVNCNIAMFGPSLGTNTVTKTYI